MIATINTHRPSFRRRAHGSLLLEVSMALGAASLLALLLMKASLLAIIGNDWTTMQTLTDAVLTRETALANRVPFADITSDLSLWPDATEGAVPDPQTIELGKIMGGAPVSGELTRFRIDEAAANDPDVNLAVWRLHSVLKYTVGEHQYVKSSSTLRAQ